MLSETPILLQHPLSGWERSGEGQWLENCNITPGSWQLRRAAETLNHSNKYSSPKFHPRKMLASSQVFADCSNYVIWLRHPAHCDVNLLTPTPTSSSNVSKQYFNLEKQNMRLMTCPDDPSQKSLMEHTDYNWINSDHCRQAPVSPISIMKNWNNNIQ